MLIASHDAHTTGGIAEEDTVSLSTKGFSHPWEHECASNSV